MDESNGDIIIYQTEDGLTKINVKIENETVWLSQQQMAELFSTSRTNIIEHINNIYEEEELNKNSTCQNFRQVRKEGNRNVTREIPFYNLDMIISLGYRVKSKVATNFRKWATERLKEYMIKGFALNDERFLKAKKSDVIISKNYLNEQEIKNLNNLVNLFLDIAENNAERSITMYMEDWKNEVENALKVFHYEVLEGKGKISHKQAVEKAENEYEKYKVIQDKNYVSDFDRLLSETKQIENK